MLTSLMCYAGCLHAEDRPPGVRQQGEPDSRGDVHPGAGESADLDSQHAPLSRPLHVPAGDSHRARRVSMYWGRWTECCLVQFLKLP